MGGSKKILIVEDDVLIAMALEARVKRWGYTSCGMVTSGEEAIHKAESEQPDIILMDVSIKGAIDGIAAAREIASRFQIPIVLMSGYSKDEIQKRHNLDCVVDFLSKPVNLDELKSVFDSIDTKSCDKVFSPKKSIH